MAGCYTTTNLLCKHVRSTVTWYLNLDRRLPDGVTVVETAADSADDNLAIEDVHVITEDTIIQQDSDCTGVQLIADRSIAVTVSGGTPSDDETTLTISWTQSEGTEDAIDCRILVGGVEAVV